MRGPTWEDVSEGVGLRVTVPVTMDPDRTVRELAPRLSVLTRERIPASSGGTGARPGVPVVTIDGYSGSGESTLAAAFARLVNGWQVLHLNDWYPGRDGLTEGAHIVRRIAANLRRRHTSSYETWDQENGRAEATISVSLAPTTIEDCGAIDAEADLSVWIVDPGEGERCSRILVRDGQAYAPH